MAKNLVIVESPTKTKTLAKFLGRGYSVAATMGHIVDLPSSRLGVDIENNFRPEYENIESKTKIIKALQDEAKSADIIYLAPDPDREGEAIAWHVASILKGKTKAELRRASFNEITKTAVLEGLKNAGRIDQNKVDAQQARRVLDRLVGYQISPFLWKTVCRGLSAGRVQSVALRLVCEREAEIRAFAPKEYWSIDVDLHKKGEKKAVFAAAVSERDGEKLEIPAETFAREIEGELRQAVYSVTSVKTSERRRQPYPPYITSTIQQDAAARIRFSPKKTMSVAQALYEGVELGDKGSAGLITYMRTDSTRIADEAQTAARELILSEYGAQYCPEKPPVYATKKRTQDAHEAIRPTYLDLPPAAVKKYLSPDQLKLYTLIWNRFVASQMMPAVIERVSVEIAARASDPKSKSAHAYTLKAGAEKVVFPGFMKVYEDVQDEDANGEKPLVLPDLAENDPLQMLDIKPEQHWTKPPPRYSEATLVKELEANGIGRPSTYAQIISTIIQRNYVRLEERRLYTSDLGETVNSILVDAFSELFNVEFTAEMELELDRIEDGEETWTEIMHTFYGPLSGSLEHATERIAEIKKTHREVLPDPCPECGSQLIVRWSRTGKFVACSAYPKCRYTSDAGSKGAAEPEVSDQTCEKCGSPMVVKSGRFGRFLACSAYPGCKSTKPIPTGVKCPEGCGGDLVPRRTKPGGPRGGRTFYSCSTYPDCKYAVWDRPIAHACPQCGSTFMLSKSTKSRGEHLMCPACKHVIQSPSTTEQPEPVEV